MDGRDNNPAMDVSKGPSPKSWVSERRNPYLQTIRRRPEGESEALLAVAIRRLEACRQNQGRSVVVTAERLIQREQAPNEIVVARRSSNGL